MHLPFLFRFRLRVEEEMLELVVRGYELECVPPPTRTHRLSLVPVQEYHAYGNFYPELLRKLHSNQNK